MALIRKKLANILKDNTVRHPVVHQTDGDRKDAAGGLQLSVIRETDNIAAE